ncbi:MAG: Gfo/Idh/MocA family oxidoreductase [Phycisphaerae bacterium]|nr:Gfo/Idh/MocA family oxidoreductase [Phycisphaerae bacterium]MDW8262031.1 Gfo/Idh/MocA family oxidoreductase [Phycisphaerales bacterium]
MTQRQPWQCELPRNPRPIVIVGCGGIVRDAHLPAYRLAGFQVAGVTDIDRQTASRLAADFGLRAVDSIAQLAGLASDPVYDVAVPAAAVLSVLEQIPAGSAVLIQKPLGEDLSQAHAIVNLCRSKRLTAAVNFQLRYAPYIAAARHLIESGAIGQLHDMEVRVTVYMPWHLWTFLEKAPRVEILYHSVHYIDLIRSFLGEPARVHALTVRHPDTLKLHSTRTNIALDYGQTIRANITTNHGHRFGPEEQESYVKWEGTRGALKARLGLLLNYPKGEPDWLRLCQLDSDGKPSGWRDVPFEGSWYPHAFIGSMASLMRYVEGSADQLPTRVEDALRTMAVVEAAYADSASGGTVVRL